MLRLISTVLMTIGYLAAAALLIFGTLAFTFGKQSGTALVLLFAAYGVGIPAAALIVLGHIGRCLTAK